MCVSLYPCVYVCVPSSPNQSRSWDVWPRMAWAAEQRCVPVPPAPSSPSKRHTAVDPHIPLWQGTGPGHQAGPGQGALTEGTCTGETTEARNSGLQMKISWLAKTCTSTVMFINGHRPCKTTFNVIDYGNTRCNYSVISPVSWAKKTCLCFTHSKTQRLTCWANEVGGRNWRTSHQTGQTCQTPLLRGPKTDQKDSRPDNDSMWWFITPHEQGLTWHLYQILWFFTTKVVNMRNRW